MTWLEMSRPPETRPKGWMVGECLWSPRKKSDGTKSKYWEAMRLVRKGDMVFHLCGGTGKAAFTGFSIVQDESISIDFGPEGPVEDYRVELGDYTLFKQPLLCAELFKKERMELEDNFKKNQKNHLKRRKYFFILSKQESCSVNLEHICLC